MPGHIDACPSTLQRDDAGILVEAARRARCPVQAVVDGPVVAAALAAVPPPTWCGCRVPLEDGPKRGL